MQSKYSQPKFEFEYIDIQKANLEELEKEWVALEQSAENSIFTSWIWISNWLKQINYNARLLRISFEGNTYGLSCVGEFTAYKNGIAVKQLWLNRTGESKLDQIWNEYNDILCTKGYEYSLRAAVLQYFDSQLVDFDELVIGVSNLNITETPRPLKMLHHLSWKTTSYLREITSEFSNLSQFLKCLSRNTRNQINRSIKLYGGIENLTFERAENVEDALQFFAMAGDFHKVRWKGQGSGFKNQHFVEFHHQFIRNSFDSGVIDIVKISAGNQVLSYLYNFVYKKRVYFYLSGIDYQKDNRLKPGLLSHALAISHYADRKCEVYDFMGGEGRYKRSLSNQSGQMVVSNFRRRTLPFLMSQELRKVKAFFNSENQNDTTIR